VHSVHCHARLILAGRMRVLRRHRHLHFGKSGGRARHSKAKSGGKPPHSKGRVSGLGVSGYSSHGGETQDKREAGTSASRIHGLLGCSAAPCRIEPSPRRQNISEGGAGGGYGW
jgi:hypothetical protein